ncbi:N,N-dimethylformamidase beta subunit family domain-containing protein [Pseudonocardia sp. GCM10023141]|uniref:N,N-dimethylformamidase beta subunit family domain-containing protein n=1 Tax=Pseudonocardia sp. GCM10023141 TaxID=3252653 RepID=UPI0036187B09
MTVICHVSDERFAALAGVDVEFDDGTDVVVLRSAPSGAVHGELAPGHYRVTLARDGYGAKRAVVQVAADGTADPAHLRLLTEAPSGYVWPKWTVAGGTGSVRVHSAEPYRLTLVRHGVEAQQVRLVGWFDEHGPRATVQVTPDGDYTQTGVGWAQHTAVTAPGASGLYYFHLETESGAHFSFPWVVAPAVPASPIAVLASTNSWLAYNNFGGRSNYINATALPPRPIVFAHTDLDRYRTGTSTEHQPADEHYRPLSFDRPEPLNQIGRDERPGDPIRGRQPCHLAAAEWRLLSWMEREGFDHDLYAEAQLHDGTLDLDRYRVLVISTHPEYWSREMYDAVYAWVHERGGKLMYLGGNGVDCEVEFLDPATLRFLTQDEDPDGPDENRMHRTHRPTSALLGVVFTHAGEGTSAPYRVVDAGHWVFAGTGLADGDVFGTESLHERIPGGASGHETDKRAPDSPVSTHLLATGLNPDSGGGEIVHVRAERGGGEVFSVGSITWSAAVQVDKGVAAVTRNVLARFLDEAP